MSGTKGALAIAAVAVLAATAACGSSTTSSSPAASNSSGSSAPAWLTTAIADTQTNSQIPTKILETGSVTPVKTAAIYNIGCNQSLEGCSNQAKSLQVAATALGYKFTLCDGGATPDTANKCFTNAVNAKPSVIIVNGIGSDIAAQGYAAAQQAGIPVIGQFTGNTPGSVSGVKTEVAGDACTVEGKMVAESIIADSNGKANALFLSTKAFNCNAQRLQGFQQEMALCTTCQSTNTDFDISTFQTALPLQLQATLQTNPKLTYIAGTFDAIANIAADAIRTAGKTNIKVIGFDANAPNLQLITNGDIQYADAATGASEPSWAAMDAAVRLLAGQTLPPSTPVTAFLITKSNIGQVGQVYNGPAGYDTQFKQLWGVS
jgi:ribose transport system substrate-binding protein